MAAPPSASPTPPLKGTQFTKLRRLFEAIDEGNDVIDQTVVDEYAALELVKKFVRNGAFQKRMLGMVKPTKSGKKLPSKKLSY